MKRPPTRIMLLGHPVVSIPAMLAALAILGAGIYGGNGIACLIGMAEMGVVQSASAHRRKFLVWKAEWDSLGEHPPAPGLTVWRVVGILLIAGLALVAYDHADTLLADTAYALGWTVARPWLVAGPVAAIVMLRIIRRRSRRVRAPRPVAVVARPLFKTPSLTDTYRVLPPYCQALLGDRP